MGGFLGQLLTMMCGSLTSLLLLGITLLIQRAPAIFSAMLALLSFLLRLTFLIYRFLLIKLPLLIGLFPPTGIVRGICTTSLSVGIAYGIMSLMDTPISLTWIGIALAHGLYIGLAWTQLADPDGLRIGIPVR